MQLAAEPLLWPCPSQALGAKQARVAAGRRIAAKNVQQRQAVIAAVARRQPVSYAAVGRLGGIEKVLRVGD